MTKREETMFGMSYTDLEAQVADILNRMSPGMLVMSMMSDAQEQMERGLIDAARRTLNRAKYVTDTRFCQQ